jgi:hypothetical protein
MFHHQNVGFKSIKNKWIEVIRIRIPKVLIQPTKQGYKVGQQHDKVMGLENLALLPSYYRWRRQWCLLEKIDGPSK